MSSIAGIETDEVEPTEEVELQRLDDEEFTLRVGPNVISLASAAIADLIALLDTSKYPDGSMGQAMHRDREYRTAGDPVLIAHTWAYDQADGTVRSGAVASEPYCKPVAGHTPNPNLFWLSVSANSKTYVAHMTRPAGQRLIVPVCRKGDAS